MNNEQNAGTAVASSGLLGDLPASQQVAILRLARRGAAHGLERYTQNYPVWDECVEAGFLTRTKTPDQPLGSYTTGYTYAVTPLFTGTPNTALTGGAAVPSNGSLGGEGGINGRC